MPFFQEESFRSFVQLPNINNFTPLIQAIQKKYGTDKPCILITGDSSSEHVEKFNRAKLLVLYKPLTDHTLLEAIHDKLERGA